MWLCGVLHLAVRRLCTRWVGVRRRYEIIGSSACASHSWRRRGVAVGGNSRSWPSWELSLRHHRCLGLHQSVFYRANQVRGEDGSRVHRPSNWLLPRLEHFLHALSCRIINDSVGFHERFEEISAEIQRVWRANILHNRVEDVESGQLLTWCRLTVRQRFASLKDLRTLYEP